MAITFECEACGKSYTVRDEFAGKTGQCKQCGQRMTIPTESDSEGYGIEGEARDPDPAPEPVAAPLPTRTFKPAPPSLEGRRPLFDPPGASRPKAGFFGGSGRNGAIGVVIVIVGLGLRVYNQWNRAQARNARNAQANANGPNFQPVLVPAGNMAGPILMPRFPNPGPAQELEPGITRQEVDLGPEEMGKPPGWSGKLWVYLPSGDHPAKSLPCILIAGAGSNLMTGMKLADGDVPEHLPYVRAGFAVVAYELDGMLNDRQNVTDADLIQSLSRFFAARGGVLNGKIALEYTLRKVPQVDPGRITAAGHSSAATLALLFAEHEPRLKSCLAYAPVPDIETDFLKQGGPDLVNNLKNGGARDLFGPFSPRTAEAKLNRPLFLFYAKDDPAAPELDAFASRMKAMNKPIRVETVPAGGHYQPMIEQGIPAAIAWLDEQGAGPNR
jgi:dienelactone hydrolase